MPKNGWKRWIVLLGPDESQLLEEWALAEERCPDQQATFIIRCVLQHLRIAGVIPPGATLLSAHLLACQQSGELG